VLSLTRRNQTDATRAVKNARNGWDDHEDNQRQIFGALLGLFALSVIVPAVRANEAADWMAEMRRQNDEFNRQAQEAAVRWTFTIADCSIGVKYRHRRTRRVLRSELTM
jgi:hypothetical protein